MRCTELPKIRYGLPKNTFFCPAFNTSGLRDQVPVGIFPAALGGRDRAVPEERVGQRRLERVARLLRDSSDLFARSVYFDIILRHFVPMLQP